MDPELHDVEAARAKAETVKDEPLEDPDAEDDGWRSTWVHGGLVERKRPAFPATTGAGASAIVFGSHASSH